MVKWLWYSVEGSDERHEFCSGNSSDLEDAASHAASEYWVLAECEDAEGWPKTFTLYETETGPSVGEFLVDVDTDPTFGVL